MAPTKSAERGPLHSLECQRQGGTGRQERDCTGEIERRCIQRYEALANQGSREKQSRDAAKRPAILMIQGRGD